MCSGKEYILPVCSAEFRVRAIVAAANCSPAVASRRAKYVDDFRVSALLQPRTHEKKLDVDAQLFSDGCSGLLI
jgi:hypothetical protein